MSGVLIGALVIITFAPRLCPPPLAAQASLEVALLFLRLRTLPLRGSLAFWQKAGVPRCSLLPGYGGLVQLLGGDGNIDQISHRLLNRSGQVFNDDQAVSKKTSVVDNGHIPVRELAADEVFLSSQSYLYF